MSRGEPVLAAWMALASPLVAEALASLGFHAVVLDMEHGTLGPDAAQDLFPAIERHRAAPLVRLPSADPYLARRLLDAGAAGFLVPVVEDVAAFTAFAAHLAYPPNGRRGVGLSRCNLWGDKFADYLRDFRPLLIPQIETRKGVVAADALAAMPQVDGLFIGPYDLSADFGAAGDFTHPDFGRAMAEVREACVRHGKVAGIHQVAPDPAELRKKVAEGYGFIAYSTDIIAMRTALGRVAEIIEGHEL